MRIDEKSEFNKELNALLDKYRVAVFSGTYISHFGDGEQIGVLGVLRSSHPCHFENLYTLSRGQSQIFESLDA